MQRTFGLLFAAVALTWGTSSAAERRSVFTSCLEKAGPSDAVLTPSSTGYNASRNANINRRISYFPAAIVFPSKPQDVQKYVKCAAAYGVAVVARSGGHSYASYGVGGQNGSLVIDLSKLKSISFIGQGGVKIQTGNRLGDLAQALWDNGQRVLPHGVCPYVGSGGHAAFGGFGPFSRVAGLLHDHITAAEVVLADGTLTTVSAKNNPDLFWALRGAGASYGIVTQWTYATLPAPPSVITYKINYDLLKAPQARDQLVKWQDIALSAPDNLSAICTIGHGIEGFGDNFYLEFRGTYFGTQTEFETLTSNWTTILSPGVLVSKANNWYDGLVELGGPLSTNGTQARQNFFTKSLFTKSALASAQWDSLFTYIGSEGAIAPVDWYIEIDRWGGGVSKRALDATSFAQRDALLSFQLYGGLIAIDAPYPTEGIPFVNGLLYSIDPNPQAAYSNYVDPTLTPAQWKLQYYGDHYPRLAAIKRAIDPKNVFHFPQSIGFQ
ncbi:unnamed protein product [Rhizoctonia solani]|uniref:FAD-binding PCMH-type domain-containing protein n=1 Tax=Rhizoctonia solani TaxID=456999 RepID=A0A8H3CGT9_9AGAM|nr:unnamed protein product [Rhizoctonia solani]